MTAPTTSLRDVTEEFELINPADIPVIAMLGGWRRAKQYATTATATSTGNPFQHFDMGLEINNQGEEPYAFAYRLGEEVARLVRLLAHVVHTSLILGKEFPGAPDSARKPAWSQQLKRLAVRLPPSA